MKGRQLLILSGWTLAPCCRRRTAVGELCWSWGSKSCKLQEAQPQWWPFHTEGTNVTYYMPRGVANIVRSDIQVLGTQQCRRRWYHFDYLSSLVRPHHKPNQYTYDSTQVLSPSAPHWIVVDFVCLMMYMHIQYPYVQLVYAKLQQKGGGKPPRIHKRHIL